MLHDYGMRISVSIGSAYYDGSNWADVVDYVKAADRLGVDAAVFRGLGFIGFAAKTENGGELAQQHPA